MAGKKNQDATQNLPSEAPTQVTDKGLRIGVPKRKDFFAALRKVAKTDKP